MKSVFVMLLLLVLAAAAAQLPPVPPSASNPPPARVIVRSPRLAASRIIKIPLVIANLPDPVYLTWDYALSPVPTNIVFEVWHNRFITNGTALADCCSPPPGWSLLVTVSVPPVKVPSYQFDFFIVRALDTVTGNYSWWNQ